MELDMMLVVVGLAFTFVGLSGMVVRARGKVTHTIFHPSFSGTGASKLGRLWKFVANYRQRIGTDAWVWLLWAGLALFASGVLVSLIR